MGAGSIGLLSVIATMILLECGCRRHAVAPTIQPNPPVKGALPATRAADEFIRFPKRTVLSAAEVQIPIEFVTYIPVLTFTSSDGVQRRMILDTGADAILITQKLVDAQRFTTRPSNRNHQDSSGSGSNTATALVDKLQIDGVRFEDFDADVAPLAVGADALLGWPAWRDLLLTIDYSRHVLVLKRGDLPEPDDRTILPLRLDHDRLMVRATLDGKEAWLNLDTGWGIGDSVELTTAHATDAAWASAPVSMMATNAPYGVAAQKLGRLRGDLILGRYRFIQPIAGTNAGAATDILGAVALANFTVTLDLHNMRVRFDRAGDEPIHSGPVSVSGFECDLRSNPLRVTGVVQNSEAQRAGLREGDLLITIDDRPALDGLLGHTKGDYVIERERDGQRSKLTFPFTKLVP